MLGTLGPVTRCDAEAMGFPASLEGGSHLILSLCFPFLAVQCLLLLACVLVLAAPGHSMLAQTLNVFKKPPSNTSASALKKTSM